MAMHCEDSKIAAYVERLVISTKTIPIFNKCLKRAKTLGTFNVHMKDDEHALNTTP